MKKKYGFLRIREYINYRLFLLAFLSFFFFSELKGQTPTVIPTGSFIINMGVTPQSIANGLKPYGLIYALLQIKCPVYWAIDTNKAKDGPDFSYNGVSYKGGTFIIEAKYRSSAVNTLITTWQGYGVQGVTSTSPVTVPLYTIFWNIPKWTMDFQNGLIATKFFTNAGIPASAYGGASSNWKTPAQLDCCDDIFVMPHADPTWATHGHLYEWINATGNGVSSGCRGGIWLGCHAGSALMDMFDNVAPVDYNMQTNFLVGKTGPASGAGPYYENALILWGNHSAGTLPYTYAYHGDPVMQFLGTIDAATQNGSEQVFIPKGGAAGWYPTTRIGVYDPDHPQRYLLSNDIQYRPAILGYGPGMGVTGNGLVMLTAAHDISKLGDNPASVAAQRAFFNFSFLVTSEKAVLPELTGLPDTLYSNLAVPLSYTLYFNTPGMGYNLQTTEWTASCGGTFVTTSSNPTIYTPPNITSPQICYISVTITDACGRKTFDTHTAVVMPCNLNITRTVTQPSCYGTSNGSIAMTISGGTGPFTWVWNRTNPAGGPVSGSGTTISNLSAGSYSVTVTDANNCAGVFSQQVNQPAQLSASTSVVNVLCYGAASGTVNLTASGGTTPYTYDWADLPGTSNPEDRAGLTAGTYSVTVTDSKGCTATASAVVFQPASALGITGTVTNVSCYGGANGAIDITASGGTPPYSYNWGGGITTEDRSGLSAGSYNVIVTDANGCTAGQGFNVTQPALLTLNTTVTQPTCPPDAQFSYSDGAIDLTVNGGTSPFSYLWTASNGGVIPSGQQNGQDLSGLITGTYSVTVTDAKGCTASLSVTLTNQNPNPVTPGTITK